MKHQIVYAIMKTPFHSLILLLCLGGLALSDASARPFTEATVTRTVNDVFLIQSDQTSIPARTNDIMRDEMVLATGQSSRAELQFPDQTLARIGSNSYFTFTEGSRDMELGRGTMLLKVPKNAGGAKITTQAVTAAITGTTVMLEANPGPTPVFSSGMTVPLLPGMVASTPTVTSPLDGTYKDQGKTTALAKEITGNVRILRPGTNQSVPLQSGDPIQPGSFILTDPSATALISPMPGVAVTIDPGSSARLEALASSAESTSRQPTVHFDLKEGAIHGAIARSGDQPVDFRIRTPQGVAAARGTVTGASTDGQTSNVFSAEGEVVWIYPNNSEQPIVPGSLIPFSGLGPNVQMGDSIPLNDPRYQQFLRQAVDLVNRAADAGLIRPDKPVAVLRSLTNAKAPLSNDQKNDLQKPRDNVNPVQGQQPGNPPTVPTTPPSGGDGNSGYSKLIVLEGTMRVFLNDRVGESQLIEPGQMIILAPNARTLPRPVNVRIDRMVQSSQLINGFDSQNDPGASQPIKNDASITQTIRDQTQQLLSGKLEDSNIVVVGTGLASGDSKPDPSNTITNRNESAPNRRNSSTTRPLPDPPSLPDSGPPSTFPDPMNIGANSSISTNPRFIEDKTNPTSPTFTGSIYYPFIDGSFAEWAFGSSNELDQRADLDSPFATTELIAGFKANTVNISGNPEIFIGSVDVPATGPIPASTIPVERLAFLGVNGANLSGVTLDNTNGDFGQLQALLIGTQDGPIDASNADLDFGDITSPLELALYAREADFTTIGSTSTSNINLNGMNFDGREFIALAGNDINWTNGSIDALFAELRAGHEVTLGTGVQINASEFDTGSLNRTTLDGATVNATDAEFDSDTEVRISSGSIDAQFLTIRADNEDIENGSAPPPATPTGDVRLVSSVFVGTPLETEIHGRNLVEITGNLDLSGGTKAMISVGGNGTLDASGDLLGITDLMGGFGSEMFIAGDLQAHNIDVHDLTLETPSASLLAYTVIPSDPNRVHNWVFESFSGDGLQPILFDGTTGGKGGELRLTSRQSLEFGNDGFGSAFFQGGDGNGFLPEGGDGGEFLAKSDDKLTVVGSTLAATTGMNFTGTPLGGNGGRITLDARNELLIDDSDIKVSHDTATKPNYASNGGGKIRIISSFSDTANTGTPAITIQNSSQIYSLLDAGATGRGGSIIIESTGPNGDIVINDSTLQASASNTEQGNLEIRATGNNSEIDIGPGTVLKATNVRLMNMVDNGVVTVRAGPQIDANFFEGAASMSNGTFRFIGNGDVVLNTSFNDISAHTVTVGGNTRVVNPGSTNVTATNHDYINGVGAGTGGFQNPVNQITPSP